MGSNHSRPKSPTNLRYSYHCHATSRRKPTVYCGYFGRARHTQLYEYRKQVPEINGRTIGKLIVQLCGNEYRHAYLNGEEETTLAFLRAANSFVPDAEDDGADLKNIAFILRQPGKEFVIQAGNGDWEYDFCEDANGEIYGQCIRKPFRRYIWDRFRQAVVRFGKVAMGYLTGGLPFQALPWYA